MGKSPKVLRLSMSSIKKYLQCPMQWYFTYILKLPSRTDYPRLCGSEVHKFVAGLYKSHSAERKFWWKTEESARKAWVVTWEKALETNRTLMLQTNKEMDDKYGAIGWICIKNYWNQNKEKPNPVYIEKKYTIPISYGVEFTGVFDQVRTVQLPWLKERRPEIFKNGNLLPNYDPYLLLDLKTGWGDFNVEDDDSDIEKVRKQFQI